MTLTRLSLLILFILIIHPSNTIKAQVVKTGIENLRESGFSVLKGKKVGLITNPTGVDSKLVSTIDILSKAEGVSLVALFGPEHGIRGDHGAGEDVEKYNDPKTGIPVYSIYGNVLKPTPEMLKGIDVLVYDIQDVGARSYTYISTLGLAMEAAAENNIEFLVLDRPNPLGGIKTEGLLVEKGFTSFVSQYPIPYIYGLTTGELAGFLNGQELLAKKLKCKLTIIPMTGWKREMTFEQTGLPWVPSSPHIPYIQSPFFYPMSGILGELNVLSIGVGYTLPFQLFAADWIDAEKLTDKMNDYQLKGLTFRPIHYQPYYALYKGTMIHGVQVYITNYDNACLTMVQFYILQACHELWPGKNVLNMAEKQHLVMFDKVSGTDRIRKNFSKTHDASTIEKIWMADCELFKEKARRYYLY